MNHDRYFRRVGMVYASAAVALLTLYGSRIASSADAVSTSAQSALLHTLDAGTPGRVFNYSANNPLQPSRHIFSGIDWKLGITASETVPLTAAAVCRSRHDVVFSLEHGRSGGTAGHLHAYPSLEAALLGAVGQHATVFIASGRLRIDRTLLIPDDTRVRACNPGRTVVWATPDLTGPMLAIRKAAGASVEGLVMESAGPHQVGVELDEARCALVAGNHMHHFATAIVLTRAAENLILGNHIEAVRDSGIEAKDASDGNVIGNNSIIGIQGSETHGGGIFLHGANRNILRDNLIRDADGMGIGIANWDATTISNGNMITGNRIENVDRLSSDSGAIYFLGRSRLDMAGQVSDNWIDGTGRSEHHSVGIYLDDSATGITVSRNVVRHVGSDAAQIHGGSNNILENNLFDLTGSHASAVLFQAAPPDTAPNNRQEHNVVRHNLVLGGASHPVYFWLDGGRPEIVANVYAGVPVENLSTNPMAEDRAPVVIATAHDDGIGAGGYDMIQRRAAQAADYVPFDASHAGPRARVNARLPDGCGHP